MEYKPPLEASEQTPEQVHSVKGAFYIDILYEAVDGKPQCDVLGFYPNHVIDKNDMKDINRNIMTFWYTEREQSHSFFFREEELEVCMIKQKQQEVE